MSRMLQTQLESAREDFSNAVETVFYEFGQLFVDGYGGDGWGCTQGTRTGDVEWVFKYTTEDDAVQFVKAEYSYEVPVFELNRYTYQMERQGTERKERDVYVVSQYSPPNVWDVNHIADALFDAIGNYLSELKSFNAHPDTAEKILDENEQLLQSIESLKSEYDEFKETIQKVQEAMQMEDLIVGVQEGYEELCAVGICDDEEDKDSVWKLFNCASKDGIQSTQRNILFKNENIALVKVKRWYDNEWYSVGYVVGVDDGDTPFFIHRLRSADELEEHTGSWTAEDVYDLMGFDKNLESDEIGFDTRYRVQGDVYFTRRDLQEEKENFAEIYAKNTVRESVKEYAGSFLEQQDLTEVFECNTFIRNRLNEDEDTPLLVWKNGYDTEQLKTLQEQMNISEEKVRLMQEQRDWSRLSQKRRRNIIRDIIEERLFQWATQEHSIPVDKIWDEALDEQRSEFENIEKSCPITLGNHLLNIRNALIHPNSSRRLEEDIEVVVPSETQLYVLHDEHNSKILTIPEGIYTFGFLEQHFNA